MSLYDKALAHPFIYDRLRPWVVGGIDMSPMFRLLDARTEDIILDVGSGTGMALEYLPAVRQYHAFDTDSQAIQYAMRRPESKRDGVRYENRQVGPEDFERIRPTRVILSGILHHLPAEEATTLLNLCGTCDSVIRVATCDNVFIPGALINNLLCRFDRGDFVRTIEEHMELIRSTKLRFHDITITRSHSKKGRAIYVMTALEP